MLTVDGLPTAAGLPLGRLPDPIKRLTDTVVGVAILMLLLPLLAFIAVAIKFEGPGPVFCRQQRVGQFGKPFALLKFRGTIATGAPDGSQRQDPWPTRVGQFLRATRIDRIPQLANVIQGDMSLVGPSPESPHFAAQLNRIIPFYSQRSHVKPGLTGWAQVNFRRGASGQEARDKLVFDLYYVKNHSQTLDARIMLSAIRLALSGNRSS